MGLLPNDGPLHRVCENGAACWGEAQDRLPPDEGETGCISQPWVGSRYRDLRLAAIGVNLNEYGGLNALVELTEEAKELIAEGCRRVRFHNTYNEYAGSFLWHRLGAYAAAIAETSRVAFVEWGDDGYPLPKNVAQSFDMIAFMEHVKCAPIGEKSKPTTAMWKRCGAHILRNELEILRPAQLLILGTSDNARYLSVQVLDAKMDCVIQHGSVISAIGSIAGNVIKIIVVPHPTSYGGASRAILDDLKQVLHRINGCAT